jgi:His-Xaa-Ser system protein HxsD
MSTDNTSYSFKVDTTIYSKSCIFRTCYKFTDNVYIFLSRSPDDADSIIVSITPKSSIEDLNRIILEFQNELIDQNTREILENEFGPLRDLIVAQAFSEGNLLSDRSPQAENESK